MSGTPFFASALLRRVAGETLRPGGLDQTRRALTRTGLAPGARLVDVGCGPGASAAMAAAELGLRVLGVEPGAEFVGQAAEKGVRVLRGTAEGLPLAEGCCDAVLCECVLSVTRDPEAAVAEMARVLAPGGWLVLSDLFRREAGGMGTVGADRASCASGAESRQALLDRLARHGLVVQAIEDQTRLLAELAARLVFAREPGEACGWDGCGRDGGGGAGGRPGYISILARKLAKEQSA